MKRSFARRAAAFTLLEIMMVVSIIMLILASGAYMMRRQFENAKISKAEMDIRGLETPLMMYQQAARGALPSTDQGLKALVEPPSPKPAGWRKQADSVPLDPWGKPYQYRYPGTKNKPGTGPGYDLYSAGPDGQFDTADDIGNWDQAG